MTQLTVTFTLNDAADRSLLKRMLKGMKGVLCNNVTIHEEQTVPSASKTDAWIEKMRALSNSVDPSIVDMDDDRTCYIMAK